MSAGKAMRRGRPAQFAPWRASIASTRASHPAVTPAILRPLNVDTIFRLNDVRRGSVPFNPRAFNRPDACQVRGRDRTVEPRPGRRGFGRRRHTSASKHTDSHARGAAQDSPARSDEARRDGAARLPPVAPLPFGPGLDRSPSGGSEGLALPGLSYSPNSVACSPHSVSE